MVSITKGIKPRLGGNMMLTPYWMEKVHCAFSECGKGGKRKDMIRLKIALPNQDREHDFFVCDDNNCFIKFAKQFITSC